jgi:hypothetical protein
VRERVGVCERVMCRGAGQRGLCRKGNTQRKRLSPGRLHQHSGWHPQEIAPLRSRAWPMRAAAT